MSKTRALVKHLSSVEYRGLYTQLIESEATKTAVILNYFRQDKLSEEEIKSKMQLSENAFYTLCSRLTEKIDLFVLETNDNKRSQLLKMVSGIDNIVLNQDRVVAVSCLKKLEKELKKEELHNELSVVYRTLKRLYFNEQKYYHYKKQFNEQNSIVRAFDEFEDNLSTYVKRYNEHLLSYEELEESVFEIYLNEFEEVSEAFDSNRLKTLFLLVEVFHILFLKKNPLTMSFITEINHQLTAVEQSVKKYKYDASYQSYLLIAQYYRLLLYYKVDTSHKALGYLFEILEPEEHLLFGNIGSICYTNYYFNLKLCFYKDELIANTVDLENDNLSRMTIDVQDKLTSTSFYSYQMLLSYYKGQYLSAVNKSIAFYKDISLVKHIRLSVDFKLLEAVIRFKNNDKQEALQLTKYAQRHIRQIGKENCLYAHYLTLFLLNILSGQTRYTVNKKSKEYITDYNEASRPMYSPLYGLYLDYPRFEVV